MKKEILLSGCALLLWFAAGAQKETLPPKESAHFQSYNALGIIAGENTSSALIQSVNGVRSSRWFVGAGAGIDDYMLRSLPLFVELRVFPSNSRSFFIYGDGGIHIPWVKNRNALLNDERSYSGGAYYDGGVGYQFPVGSGNALLVSAGFTEKQHREETRSANPCLIGPCPAYTNRYDYKLRRLSFKVGVML